MFREFVKGMTKAISDVSAEKKATNDFASLFPNKEKNALSQMGADLLAPMAGKWYADATQEKRHADVEATFDYLWKN